RVVLDVELDERMRIPEGEPRHGAGQRHGLRRIVGSVRAVMREHRRRRQEHHHRDQGPFDHASHTDLPHCPTGGYSERHDHARGSDQQARRVNKLTNPGAVCKLHVPAVYDDEAMTMTPKILLSATALVVLTLSANAIVAQEGSEAVSLVSPKYGTWGFDVTGMDLSVKPGDDFFRYANGKGAERPQIPSDRTGYGNFTKLAELSENRLHAILEDAAAGKINDPDASKVAAAYASFMDEALADQQIGRA